MGLPKKLIEVALPLKAQRLGLEACASPLNPVAVLINKAMIEIPPKFTGRPPINPESRRHMFGEDAEFREEKTVKVGKRKDVEAAKNGTRLACGANFRCLRAGTKVAGDHAHGA